MVLIVRGRLADPDEQLVVTLQQSIGGSIFRGDMNVDQISDHTIVVGGQIANQLYNDLVFRGYVPSIEDKTRGFGHVLYTNVNGFNVWCLVGWDLEDTSVAVNYIITKGFPDSSVIVPREGTGKGVVALDYPLLPRFIWNSIVTKAFDILTSINNRIGSYFSGVTIDNVWFDNSRQTVFIMYSTSGGSSSIQSTIAVLPIIILVGLAIAAIAGIVIWIASAFQAQAQSSARIVESVSQARVSESANQTAETIITDPSLSEEQKINALKTLYEGNAKIGENSKNPSSPGFLDTLFGDVGKIIAGVVIAVAAIFLIQAFAKSKKD